MLLNVMAVSFGETEEQAIPSIGFFLHMYQPPIPIQREDILERIINISYKPVVQGFLEHPTARATININASLTELLVEYAPDVIDNLMLLAESNQIEFVDSGAYHPILPLLDTDFQIAHIKLNARINSNIFGQYYRPEGFFPPELAIDRSLPSLLNSLDYKYMITPSTAFVDLKKVGLPYVPFEQPNTKLYEKFFLMTRHRTLSNDLAFRNFNTPFNFGKAIEHYSSNVRSAPIIGMDFETFGEHHKKYEEFLFDALDNHVRSMQLQELILIHESETTDYEITTEDFRASTWSTNDHEANIGIPFPLWDHPWNSLHQLTLALMDVLIKGVELMDKPFDNNDYKELIPVLKSQQSCQLWWESEGRFGPDIVQRAINFQIDALDRLTELVESQNRDRAVAMRSLIDLGKRLVNKIEHLIDLKK